MKVSIKQALWAPALLASLAGCGASDALLAQRGPASSQGSLGKIAVEDNRSPWQKMKDSVASTLGSDKESTAKESEEVSLNKMPPANPQLCVRVAQLHERSGNHAGAADQYQRALKADPNCLDALLGYARMNDRLGRYPQALPLYEEAARKHPTSATALNDWAICLTNSGKPDAAAAVMTKAVNLQPANPLYRNNLATILVRMNRGPEALQHLSAVHPPAVAHYNLGYLYRRAGNVEAARQHFALAVQADPSFAPAKQYLAELDGAPRPSLAQAPTVVGAAQAATTLPPGAPR
jgi:protein O-GlcNAc transferase